MGAALGIIGMLLALAGIIMFFIALVRKRGWGVFRSLVLFGVGVVMFIVGVAISPTTPPTPAPAAAPAPQETPAPTPAPSISRIGELAVYTKGPGLDVWFNLLDKDGRQVKTNGDLEFTIWSKGDKIVYQMKTTVTKADFKRVERLFGREKLLVYTWFIPFDEIERYISDRGRARLVFTPEGQPPLTPVEDDYVEIPKMTDAEIIQLFESRFQQAAQVLQETATKGNFSITLVRFGLFTHLEYETWGDEVTHLRMDLSVTNIGSEKDYLFESDAVVLDDLGNQYDAEWDGTLDLGELYPDVRREGYLLFPVPKKEATQIRLLVTKSAYPEDITYEFTISMSNH